MGYKPHVSRQQDSGLKLSTRPSQRPAQVINQNDTNGNVLRILPKVAGENTRLKDLKSLTTWHVDVSLLMAQEQYFVYADEILAWTNYEGRLRDGKLQINTLQKPPAPKRPDLKIP
jgi:hypothetical protein